MAKPRVIPRSLMLAFKNDREVQAFFREIGLKTIDGNISIDELAQVLFTLHNDKTTELEYRISELERKIRLLPTSDEINQELEETRRMAAWRLPQKHS